MRRFTYITALLIFFLLTGIVSRGQEAMDMMEKLMQHYKDLNTCFIEQTIKFYPNYQAVEAKEIKKGIIKKKGEKGYSNYLNSEVVYGEKYLVAIDHTLNRVKLAKKDKSYQRILQWFQVDSIKQFIKSSSYTQIGRQTGKVSMKYRPDQRLKKMDIYFNEQRYRINRLELFFRHPFQHKKLQKAQRPRVEIDYTKYRENIELQEETFSIYRFVHKEQGNYTLNEEIEDYQFINLLQYY